MRIKLVIAVGVFLLLYGKASAQYTVEVKNAPFDRFMEQVKRETGLSYSYTFKDEAWYSAMQKVTLSVKNGSLEKLMKLGLTNQPFDWYVHQNTIFIIPIPIQGMVTNENNEPVIGATISIEGTNTVTTSDANGQFVLSTESFSCVLNVASISHETREVPVHGRMEQRISLKTKATVLQEAVYDAQTGYQNIPRNRITGSYEKPDMSRFIDNASPNVLSNTQWLGASLLFSHDASSNNYVGITIRGRSTLHLNTDPLVVIDNWPYEGDIRNIPLNPNVVESITILKDAAATAIWGARAGNGVIIYTTKKGKGAQKASVQFISNLTFTKRPDVFYRPALNSASFIEFETDLFKKGYYDKFKDLRGLVSPVIDILFQKDKGLISAQDAEARINVLKSVDNRYDLSKYFYRTGINQQYTVNAAGHSNMHRLFFSLGHERNLSNSINSRYHQTTIFSNGELSPLKNLKLGGSMQYIHNYTLNNDPVPEMRWLYEDLADEQGTALPAYADLRKSYKDTVGGGRLPDWNYRPLDDMRNRENRVTTDKLRMEARLQYRFARYFKLQLLCLYAFENGEGQNYMSPELYYVRNLVNSYTNLSSGSVVQPIPYGAILDEKNLKSETRNQRLQIDYNQAWDNHQVATILGIEQRFTNSKVSSVRRYGYDRDQHTEASINYDLLYQQIYIESQSLSRRKKIPNPGNSHSNEDYYLSAYTTTSYTFKDRYTASASFRIDKSNFFGSAVRYDFEPLWSAGAAWMISKEDFYHFDAVPYLKLRSSFGYSGNAIKSVPSLSTIGNAGTSNYNEPINNPDKTFRPEKVEMLNIGLDFGIKNKNLEGSVEFYRKRSFDLLAKSNDDYNKGLTSFSGNVAEMKATGADLNLNFKQTGRLLTWTSSLLVSYNRTIVTRYPYAAAEAWQYADRDFHFALEGRSPLPMLGFAWRGLDHDTGDPLGTMKGQPTGSYDTILTKTPVEELVYEGPQEPRLFGSWFNQLSIKGFFVSVNLVYKAGHYIRVPTVDYARMAQGNYLGHPDYLNRWQQPGDETYTSVPSVPSGTVPLPQRDAFNTYSAIHIQKADFIQWQQIRIGYNAQPQWIQGTPVVAARVFVQAENLGYLYQSTSRTIDPDTNTGLPAPRTFTVGVRVDLK